MAEQVGLAARPRVGSGKSEAKALRRDGRVPAIAYGADLDPTPISVDALELYHALHTDAGANAILRVEFDGESHLALAREIQRHPVRRNVLHVDFVTVSRNVKVTVDVPVHLEGHAPGVDEGGITDQTLHTLQVEVLPLEVPDSINLDISDLGVGDVKRVCDVRVPEGVTILDDPETAVVSVVVPQAELPEEETAAELAADEEQAGGATAEEAGEPDEG